MGLEIISNSIPKMTKTDPFKIQSLIGSRQYDHSIYPRFKEGNAQSDCF